MSNIVWSFGIALEAEDRTEAPIGAAVERIQQLGKALKALEEAQGIINNRWGTFDTTIDEVRNSLKGITTATQNTQTANEAALQSVNDLTEQYRREQLGFTDFAVSVASGVDTIVNAIYRAFSFIGEITKFPITIVQGLVNLLERIPDVVSNWIFGKSFSQFISDLRNAHAAVNEFSNLGNRIAPLDQSIRQLTAGMGLGASGGTRFLDLMTKVGISTGVPLNNLSDITIALGHLGAELDNTSGKNVFSEEQLTFLGKLTQAFGFSAESAAQFARQSDVLQLNMKELADKTLLFQTTFKVPGLLQNLPEVVNAATSAMGRFGKTVIGNSKQVIESIVKTAAVITKGLGKDSKEAFNLAQSGFERFSGEIFQNRELMVGLTDSISPLQMALLEGGSSWQGMMNILKLGQKDQLGAAGAIRQLQQSLGFGPRAERFELSMRKMLPEALRDLVYLEGAYEKAIKARDEAAKRAAERPADFDRMYQDMQNNFQSAKDAFDGVKSAIQSIFEIIFVEDMAGVFANLTKKFSETGETIRAQFATIKNDPAIKDLRDKLKGVVATLIGIGESAGMLGKSFAIIPIITGLFTPLTFVIDLFESSIVRAGTKASFSLTQFLFNIYKGTTFFTTFQKLVSNISSIISDKSIPGFNKFGLVIREVLSGAAQYFDDFFFGLPTKIANAFSGGMDEKKVTFQSTIVNIFDSMTKIASQETKKFADWLVNDSDIVKAFTTLGTNIGGTLGKITKSIIDFFRNMFSKDKGKESISSSINSVLDDFVDDDDDFLGNIKKIGSTIGEAIHSGLSGAINAFLAEFGMNQGHVTAGILGMVQTAANAIGGLINNISGAIASVLEAIDFVQSTKEKADLIALNSQLWAAKKIRANEESPFVRFIRTDDSALVAAKGQVDQIGSEIAAIEAAQRGRTNRISSLRKGPIDLESFNKAINFTKMAPPQPAEASKPNISNIPSAVNTPPPTNDTAQIANLINQATVGKGESDKIKVEIAFNETAAGLLFARILNEQQFRR